MDLHDAPRTCPKCKQKDAIPVGDSRLSCPLCREKAKEWQRNYYYRAKSAKKIENERAGGSTTVNKPLKRKREASTVEYQASDRLYKALRTTLRDGTSSAAAHRMLSFRGCFSIVTDPSVNHLARARAVVKDLKKIAKYPFANVYRDKASDNSSASARITADCRCLTLVDVAGSSSSSNTRYPPVGKSAPGAASSPLGASSHYLNSGASSSPMVAVPNENGNGDKLVEALEASFERNCGGKVKVSVKGDFSHPLGISGQKVTVKVVH